MNQEEANIKAGKNLKEFMEAQKASEEVLREFQQFASKFVERIITDDVDEETAVYIICVKALCRLNDHNRARVITQIAEKFRDSMLTRKELMEKEMQLLSDKIITMKEGVRKSEEILLRKNEDLREELGEPLELTEQVNTPEASMPIETAIKRGRPPKTFRLKDYSQKVKL